MHSADIGPARFFMSPWHRPLLLMGLSLFLTRCEVGTDTDCINSNSEDPACLRAIGEKKASYTPASLELNSETGSFTFGDVLLNESKQLTLTAKSTGERAAVLKDVSNEGLDLASPMELGGGTCVTGMRLGNGESCTLILSFKPLEAIVSKDTPLLHFSSENLDDALLITQELEGTGVTTAPPGHNNPSPDEEPPVDPGVPRAVLVMEHEPVFHPGLTAVALVNWNNTFINTSPSDRSFTVKNTGDGPATYTSLTAGGITGFSAPMSLTGSTCGMTLAAGASCAVTVRYRPTSVATTAQTIVLGYNDGTNSRTSSGLITGTSVSAAVLTVTGHDFGIKAKNSSTDQALTVTNSGNSTATFATMDTASLGLSSYLSYVSKTCGSTLDPSESCTITVRYAPTDNNSHISQTLNLGYNDGLTSQTATSTVTGTTPALLILEEGALFAFEMNFAVNLLDFEGDDVNAPYQKYVVMRNEGGTGATGIDQVPGSGTGLGVTSPFAFGNSNTCTTSLSQGADCSFEVVFSFVDYNPYTRTLGINYNNGITTTSVQGTIYGKLEEWDCHCLVESDPSAL